MGILGLAHLGADWTDIQTFARVESQFSGICAKTRSPILDISAVAGPQFFPPSKAANVPSTKSITDPPPPQTHISGSLTHNASPAARVFFKGKVNSQRHLKITTCNHNC